MPKVKFMKTKLSDSSRRIGQEGNREDEGNQQAKRNGAKLGSSNVGGNYSTKGICNCLLIML